jgi:hypothetical protein
MDKKRGRHTRRMAGDDGGIARQIKTIATHIYVTIDQGAGVADDKAFPAREGREKPGPAGAHKTHVKMLQVLPCSRS